jgi:hypothetical protein
MNVPFAPEAITTAWLTQVLRESSAMETANVVSFDTEAVGVGKGILGRLVRLALHYDRNEDRAPRSIIAKFPSDNPKVKAFSTRTRRAEREMRFYQEIADRSELRTPRCYFSAIDTEAGDFALLLEDLAPARSGDWVAGCSPEEAALAVCEIAKFHARWWESPYLAEIDWVPQLELDVAELQDWYWNSWEPFYDRARSRFPDTLLKIGERLGR